MDLIMSTVRLEALPPPELGPGERMVATEQTGQLMSLLYEYPPFEIEIERARTQVQKLVEAGQASDKQRLKSNPLIRKIPG